MKNKETRKNKIILSSIHLMYLKGYNSTSVKDITDAASIPKGSFYNYFKDKEHYAVDAVKFYQTETVKEYINILKDQSLEPIARIENYLNKVVENFSANDFKLGCFAANLAQEMGDISPLISKAIKGFFDYIENLMCNNLTEAVKMGVLTLNANNRADNNYALKSLASHIISGLNGSILRAKTTRNRAVLDEFLYTVYEVILK